ncbi:glycosyltransferase family 9 protein [Pedosphaera parvula]|uniref:Glycosyl transferase family 9 n=1 Tax=Pedosphaera parvula (strain Ellin514) TaxID=320771 RepID=B9XG77_PEDPL|nr:glycosyltransferase family 9 protein [Pedosphaera parvula]EEF61239.1 glycosyl transferase family 9 [Pedosphaera parvula Ellin514]
MENILLIKLKCMGDVVFTIPAVHLLRANFPKARITYLTSQENRAIVEQFDGVDEVWSIDRAVFKRGDLKCALSSMLNLLGRLRRAKFSLVIDLQSYGETALLTRLTGANERWAWVLGDRFRRHAYTKVIPRQDHRHPVDVNLDLLTQFGLKTAPVCNKLSVVGEGQDAAYQFFARNQLDPLKPTVVIQAFTSAAHKNWPLEHYLAVAKHWRNQGVQIIFSGGMKEKHLFGAVEAEGFPVCIGESFRTLSWIIKLSKLVIGGDTGLLHLALSIGTQVVVLMVPSGTGSPIPYSHPECVVKPTVGDDLKTITIQIVNDSIGRVLLCRELSANLPNQPRVW